jgi:hypothetical protein
VKIGFFGDKRGEIEGKTGEKRGISGCFLGFCFCKSFVFESRACKSFILRFGVWGMGARGSGDQKALGLVEVLCIHGMSMRRAG